MKRLAEWLHRLAHRLGAGTDLEPYEALDIVLEVLHRVERDALLDWYAYGIKTLSVADDRSFDRFPPAAEYADWKRAHYEAIKEILGRDFV